MRDFRPTMNYDLDVIIHLLVKTVSDDLMCSTSEKLIAYHRLVGIKLSLVSLNSTLYAPT